MYVTVDLGDAKNDTVKYRVYCGQLFYTRGQYQLKWTVNQCLKFKEIIKKFKEIRLLLFCSYFVSF